MDVPICVRGTSLGHVLLKRKLITHPLRHLGLLTVFLSAKVRTTYVLVKVVNDHQYIETDVFAFENQKIKVDDPHFSKNFRQTRNSLSSLTRIIVRDDYQHELQLSGATTCVRRDLGTGCD